MLTATADSTDESSQTVTVELGPDGSETNRFDHTSLSTNVGGGADPSITANSFDVVVNDNDATTVTSSRRTPWPPKAATASLVLTLGRALWAGESLAVPLGFSGGAVGTDFTLPLSGSPTGVTMSGSTVTFGGSGSATVATVLLSTSQDVDTTDETVTVSIPSSSTGSGTILTAAGLDGGATGSRSGAGQIILSDDDTAPPAKPTGFSATAGNGEVSRPRQQRHHRLPGPAEGGWWQLRQLATISGSGVSTVSHTVSGLTNGTAYTFRIRAVAATVTRRPIGRAAHWWW
ncbi:MAG: hypothetical protein F4025_07485 [Synechococcus sp. SB0669_bin_7]|nr:hypothetical protein [Synechococcus sp. SB0675_bin_7]MYK86225.1 hypothetical protein [Synechococcus sp. SB0669_bin_7]